MIARFDEVILTKLNKVQLNNFSQEVKLKYETRKNFQDHVTEINGRTTNLEAIAIQNKSNKPDIISHIDRQIDKEV